uniref:Fibronectin type-III domain-containing protein n=1 Tax=Scophthalmus maximus TaxID=52904 RepID=A0A8D2ZP28_SCOMX
MREYKRRGQEENINVKQAPTTRNDESVLTETQGMVIKARITNVHNEKQSLNSSRDVEEEKPQNYSDFEIIASESIEDKSQALKVEASLKASFLSGLVEVGGSAKYLNDKKASKDQARVTLQYKATTKFQELSMYHLGRGNVKHPYVFDKGIATHVVTAITYGAQAFFVFDRSVSEKEDHQDIQGNLKVMIKKIPGLAIEGEGSLNMEDKDIANVKEFSCRFHGDFSLQKPPSSFQDAVEVYQNLPTLMGVHGENTVPMRVWLLPLTVLDSTAAHLILLEDFSELEMRYSDALRTATAHQFPQVGKKLKSFKQMCLLFKLEFQQNLAKKLQSIRGGGEEEAALAEILMKKQSSPFNSENLNVWMDCKEREISILKSFTNMMKNTKIIPSQNGLHEETLSAEHAVCFIFTSLGSAEPYLSALSNYLKVSIKPDDPQDPHAHDVEKEQWYLSKQVFDTLREKAKLFSDFAEANKENKKIKFLTVGLTNDTHKGSSIYLYKDGSSLSENFEPPSKPETVTVSDINHNSVTLKITPPGCGAENITSYSVEYSVSGKDGWQQKTASDAEVTVSGLSPNTKYVFRCRAVTSVGVGPVNQVNESVKTLSCSPPGKPQVEPTSSDISVSWQRPAEPGQDVQILSYIVEYAQTDEGGDLQWNQTMSRAEKVIVSGLQSESEYVVRVMCDCGAAGRSKHSITVTVCTTKVSPLTEFLKRKSKKMISESPSVYKLPLTEDDVGAIGCRRLNFGKESARKNRTIVLVGVSGSQKSTLIDGMINYIVGVEWKDNFRFTLFDERKASVSTVYRINHQEGFKIDYSLTIVDTGDDGGSENFSESHRTSHFNPSINEYAKEVDALCFVVPAPLERLTETQKHLFYSLTKSFSKDVSENIRVLVTSADGGRPPVLRAISAGDVRCPKAEDGLPLHFKFNNSALFAHNKPSAARAREDGEEENYDQMFWNMGSKSMKMFFVALNEMETKSLARTNEDIRDALLQIARDLENDGKFQSQLALLHRS